MWNAMKDIMFEKLPEMNPADIETISFEDLMAAGIKEMEERFTVDAEGELVMLEDLDGYSSGDEFNDIIDEDADLEAILDEW
jgi:hypothetical protein